VALVVRGMAGAGGGTPAGRAQGQTPGPGSPAGTRAGAGGRRLVRPPRSC
jgi:hypothetical protein